MRTRLTMALGVMLAGVFATAWLSADMAQAGALDVGQSKTVTVHAERMWNESGVFLSNGKKYKFTVASPAWNNGNRVTDAGGYSDGGSVRHSDYKRMALVGEIHNVANPTVYTSATSYLGRKFLIGLGRDSYTAATSGWLVLVANDCPVVMSFSVPCYADNSRVVTLTVRRIE
jgi:hypothetical protein